MAIFRPSYHFCYQYTSFVDLTLEINIEKASPSTQQQNKIDVILLWFFSSVLFRACFFLSTLSRRACALLGQDDKFVFLWFTVYRSAVNYNMARKPCPFLYNNNSRTFLILIIEVIRLSIQVDIIQPTYVCYATIFL